MKVWVVTTGSSDIQLKDEEQWHDWHRTNKKNYYNLPFKAKPVDDDDVDTYYRIAPRVLGIASQFTLEEMWESLAFPLLDEFTPHLQPEGIDQIILLTTDQSAIFDKDKRENLKCPYWQDTCTLQPIFHRYFQEKFPNAEVIALSLSPQAGSSGLDDWNEVLELVRQTLSSPELTAKIGEPEELETVYVSHQAGTPAISSAVQFISLARFRKNVQFLVSNEYDRKTRTIPRSVYLREIQRQEAKALLAQYDYAGVRNILGLTDIVPTTPKDKQIKILLDAGEQWNFANFNKFKERLKNSKWIEVGEFPWWRLGYESAYLALIRLEQKNTVDSIFHSFRSVEGLLAKWLDKYHSKCVEKNKIRLPKEIDVPWYPYKSNELNAHGVGLYYAFLELEGIDNRTIPPDFKAFGETVFGNRNKMFHNLAGAEGEAAVFSFWGLPEGLEREKAIQMLEKRLLTCLNCIAKESIEQLKDISLMAKVHQTLVNEIISC